MAFFLVVPCLAQKAFVHGTIHVGNGELIEDGMLVVRGDSIAFVGKFDESLLDTTFEVISAKGKDLYPGLIAPNTSLGLVEVESVPASRDFDEVGDLNPHVVSATAYNVDSRIIPTTLSNGVLFAESTPRGGLLSGTASIVRLAGDHIDEVLVERKGGVHVNWPSALYQSDWFTRQSNVRSNKGREKHLLKLESFFEDAYQAQERNDVSNLKLEAMKGVFDSSQTLFIHVQDAKEIMLAVQFFQGLHVKRMAIVGARDAWMVADFLVENKVSVVLSRILDLPTRVDDGPASLFFVPKKLKDAGVLFCFDYDGEMEVMMQRSLPFLAGTAVAYGLSREEALSAVTLNTAQILGVDYRIGSLEVGKEASFVMVKGDLLDAMQSNVEMIYVNGVEVEVENWQEKLANEYQED